MAGGSGSGCPTRVPSRSQTVVRSSGGWRGLGDLPPGQLISIVLLDGVGLGALPCGFLHKAAS